MSAMGMVVTAPMTFEEFEGLPDTPDHLELLEGELIQMPPAELRHMETAERLFDLLRAALKQLRDAKAAVELGKAHMEMGYLLTSAPRSWIQPDVSLTHPNQPHGKYYEGAPQLVLEIVSAEDRAVHLEKKVRLFLRHGAQEVWLIYPETRHAYVYKPHVAAAVREDKYIHSDLLPTIDIPFDQFL